MMTAGIAGDGIAAQLLAFALVNAGWQVSLFGSGIKNNCSHTAAGLLTPLSELEKNDFVIFQLGIEALTQHWPFILKELAQPIYFRQWGTLVLSHPKDQADLQRFMQIISSKLNDSSYYRLLNKADIIQLEHELQTFEQGYYFSTEGQIDNQALLSNMSHYLGQRIVWQSHSVVTDISPGKITSGGKVHKFDMVFDCRGLGAKMMFEDLRSIRGELIWLSAPDVSIQRPIRYLHPRYSLYIVPRPEHVYIVGSSEIETESNHPITVRTTLELLTALYCIQPKFAEAHIIKTATQCRPTLANHLPKIKYADGFMAINGLYRHGYLIAPTLVFAVMQWLKHGMTSVTHQQLFEKVEGKI